jgi:hypothetical protein
MNFWLFSFPLIAGSSIYECHSSFQLHQCTRCFSWIIPWIHFEPLLLALSAFMKVALRWQWLSTLTNSTTASGGMGGSKVAVVSCYNFCHWLRRIKWLSWSFTLQMLTKWWEKFLVSLALARRVNILCPSTILGPLHSPVYVANCLFVLSWYFMHNNSCVH